MNKQVLYFLLFLLCVYLLLSQFREEKFITSFVVKMMPNAVKSGWF